VKLMVAGLSKSDTATPVVATCYNKLTKYSL